MTTTSPRPTSIRIFLATGTPDGIRLVEKSNWTGKAVVAGRSQLKDALKRPELSGPGVYILTGPGSGIARRIYIGESDALSTRLNQHHSREFWTQFVAFSSTNEGLNKASVLVGGSSNRRVAWKNGGGVTLKEIQDGRGEGL